MKKGLLLIVAFLLNIGINASSFVESYVYYKVLSNNKVEVTKDPYTYSGTIYIPSTVIHDGTVYTVVGIEDWAFGNNKALKGVKISEGLLRIGESAFQGCKALTSIDIPNSVTDIGFRAFYDSGLQILKIGNGVVNIGKDAFAHTSLQCDSEGFLYRDNCLLQCTAYDYEGEIKIEKGTRIIAANAFQDRYNITSIDIPNSVTHIGNEAFYNCTGITSITIPNSVVAIGSRAFRNCSGLTSVLMGSSISYISSYAFDGCTSLKEVYITDIDKWAEIEFGDPVANPMYYAHYLYLNDENVANLIFNKATKIENYAFSGCSQLASITIPNSITKIGDGAFSDCCGIKLINVEESNTKYDSRNNCNAIIETESNTLIVGCKNTIIPNSVICIGNHAYSGCSSLTSVTIPNGVTSIGDYAYQNCSGLTSVIIPNSVTSIGHYAFGGCVGIKDIYNYATTPQNVGTYPFSGLSSHTTLHVLKGHKTIYSLADNWKDLTIVDDLNNYIKATSINIDKNKLALEDCQTFALNATVLPEDATDKSVTWSSDNESVATVVDGVVTAVAVGVANITAKTNDGSNLSATCVVTVTSKETPSEDIEPSTDISKFTNVLYINDVEASQGAALSLPLNMKNAEEDITAFECKVYLPAGVEWAYTIDKRGNKIFVQPTFNEERTDANYHTINSIKQMEDGGYYVIVYSDKKEIILDKDGAILYMPLTVSEEIEPGDYNIFVKDIVMVNENTEQVLISKTISKLTIPAYTLGDANDDGMINITDVVAVISYMLKESPNPFIFKAADVNCDEMINVTDVVGIIDIMTSGASSAKPEMAMAKKTVKKSTKTGNSLEIVPFTVAAGTTSMNVALELNNPGDEFTALECKVFLPEGVDWDYTIDRRGNKIYKQPTFNEDRTDANYHTINSISKVDGGYYVIVYSDKKEIFLDEDGALLYLPLVFDENINPGVYDIRVGDIVLARPDVTQELLDDYTASVLVGSPEIASLSLNGDFTAKAIGEYNTALASNTKVAAMDFSNATDIDASAAIATGNRNLLVYVAEGKNVKNENNAVIGDACANLVLTDGYSFCAPKAFTAAKASYTRTATNTHGTLCLPFAPTSVAGDLYELTSSTETSLTFSPVITPEANVPYLYYCENDKVEASNVAVGTEGAGSVTSGDWTMTGTYEPQVFSASDNAFAMFEGKLYKNTGTLTMNPFRAYFTTSGSAAKADIFVETPTGIENISAGSTENNGRMYNLQGVMVNKNYQGMKIVNGKKYIK